MRVAWKSKANLIIGTVRGGLKSKVNRELKIKSKLTAFALNVLVSG